MTKLKNTKKGMAKKALSISLVAAMLATSNVPVWAAEDIFSSSENAAVETETSVEDILSAPGDTPVANDDVSAASFVEEEVDAGIELQAAADYNIDTNMELKDGDWASGLILAKKEGETKDAKFEITDKNGLPVNTVTLEIYSGDAKGTLIETKKDISIDATTGLDGITNALEGVKVGLAAYKNSSQVTVKVYAPDEKEAVYTLTANVKPVDISAETGGWTVDADTSKDLLYNGDYQNPKVTVTSENYKDADGNKIEAPVVVKIDDEKEAKNVGTYKYHVEGVDADGFTGTLAAGKFEIKPAQIKEADGTENLSVVISGDAIYTGSTTIKPTVVIKDKFTNTVIPEELYTVVMKDDKKNVGSYTKADVEITLKETAKIGDEDVTNNFAAVDVASLATGTFKINALDLSKLDDRYDITVAPRQSDGTYAAWQGVTFTDKKTAETYTGADEIAKILPTGELTPVVNTTAKTFTIRATSATDTNIINEYTKSISIVAHVISPKDVTFPVGTNVTGTAYKEKKNLSEVATDIQDALDATTYNGSEQKPLEAAFSNLIWTESSTVADKKVVLGTDYDIKYTNNKDSSEVSKKKATVTLQFKGEYAGTISYEFEINRAEAAVTGEEVPYEAGKSRFGVNAKVVTTVNGVETPVPTDKYTVTTTKYATKISETTDTNKEGIAEGTVTFNDKNYKITGATNATNGPAANEDGYWFKKIESKVVARTLADCTATVDGTYVYTGEAINPKLIVKDGTTTLVEGTDYTITSKVGTNAGPAHVIITGKGKYTGTLTVNYTIAKANLTSAVVLNGEGKSNYDVGYTGYAVTPDVETVKIGNAVLAKYDPATKKGDYTLTWDENAIEVGTYNFTITAAASSTKVEGEYKGTFKVVPSKLSGSFATKLGLDKVGEGEILTVEKTGAYYTGKAITLADFKTKYVLIDNNNKVLTEGKDYRLEYKNNTDAGLAEVSAYGLGNHVVVNATTGKEEAISTMQYIIDNLGVITVDSIEKINDVEYAGGLAVEPQVVILDKNKNRLVQGKDYIVETKVTDIKADDGKYIGTDVTITGKGAYITADKATTKDTTATTPAGANKAITAKADLTWKVTKKDLKTTTITVSDKTVTVMNGTVIVPENEYDVKFSEDGKTVTVSAKADSKHYTGSQEKSTDSKELGTPVIKEVKVTNNKANIILSGSVDNAIGYDYVVSTVNDYKNGRVAIDKNQVATQSTIQYLPKGEYYAYLHAWKRDENGKKVFRADGGWSNIVKFTVTTTTPDQPLVTKVAVKGSTVTVTYTKTKNATGYDIVLGSKTKKVNGELRPVEYGKLVKKIKKGNTVTATFKNVPKGTYYAGLHAYNRTSVNNSKVFSPWSNSKKVVVK